jgi:hypothetical protein
VLGTPPGNLNALNLNLIVNRPHQLVLPFAAPNRISFVRYERAGRAVRLSLPYPASSFTVTLWGSPVTRATALSDLDHGGTKYFHDAGAGRLHLRLVSSNGNWEEYVVRRP